MLRPSTEQPPTRTIVDAFGDSIIQLSSFSLSSSSSQSNRRFSRPRLSLSHHGLSFNNNAANRGSASSFRGEAVLVAQASSGNSLGSSPFPRNPAVMSAAEVVEQSPTEEEPPSISRHAVLYANHLETCEGSFQRCFRSFGSNNDNNEGGHRSCSSTDPTSQITTGEDSNSVVTMARSGVSQRQASVGSQGVVTFVLPPPPPSPHPPVHFVPTTSPLLVFPKPSVTYPPPQHSLRLRTRRASATPDGLMESPTSTLPPPRLLGCLTALPTLQLPECPSSDSSSSEEEDDIEKESETDCPPVATPPQANVSATSDGQVPSSCGVVPLLRSPQDSTRAMQPSTSEGSISQDLPSCLGETKKCLDVEGHQGESVLAALETVRSQQQQQQQQQEAKSHVCPQKPQTDTLLCGADSNTGEKLTRCVPPEASKVIHDEQRTEESYNADTSFPLVRFERKLTTAPPPAAAAAGGGTPRGGPCLSTVANANSSTTTISTSTKSTSMRAATTAATLFEPNCVLPTFVDYNDAVVTHRYATLRSSFSQLPPSRHISASASTFPNQKSDSTVGSRDSVRDMSAAKKHSPSELVEVESCVMEGGTTPLFIPSPPKFGLGKRTNSLSPVQKQQESQDE